MDFIIPMNITRSYLLSCYSEELYMSFYLGLPVRKGLFCSPLRTDHEVTCSFFRSKSNGRLYFHDFATGEVLDFVHVVMRRYNLGYHAALRRIAYDFSILSSVSTYYAPPSFVSRLDPADIRVTVRDFSEDDLRYWSYYGITRKILDDYRVYSCRYVFLDGNLFLVDRKLTFGYFGGVSSDREFWKIYCPGRDCGKFPISNWGKSLIQGMDMLSDTGDYLVITKSLKDVMCLRSLGIDAIAPLSEAVFLSDAVYKSLCDRFSYLILFYDNDYAGISNMRKIRSSHDSLRILFIPRRYGAKDISDFYKLYGRRRTIDLCLEGRDYLSFIK